MLVSILTPFSVHEDGQQFFELLWEFVHDRRLALMVFEESQRCVLRADFLRRAGPRVPKRKASALRPPLTIDQLDGPEPVWSAVRAFLIDLRTEAERDDMTIRFVSR